MANAELSTTAGVAETNASISVESLLEEIRRLEGGHESETTVSTVISEAETELLGDASIQYEEKHVKDSLNVLLLSLISLRGKNTYGQQFVDDLDEEFDTTLNPGSIYPPLSELHESGRIEQLELARTKEYVLDDSDAARSDIVAATRQHFAMGVLFNVVLGLGDFTRR